jgi:hypothetical protein
MTADALYLFIPLLLLKGFAPHYLNRYITLYLRGEIPVLSIMSTFTLRQTTIPS